MTNMLIMLIILGKLAWWGGPTSLPQVPQKTNMINISLVLATLLKNKD